MHPLILEELRRKKKAAGGHGGDIMFHLESDTFDGDTNFVDSSPLAATLTVGTEITHSTAQQQIGASSILFPNNTLHSQKHLWTNQQAGWNWGDVEFYFKCYFYLLAKNIHQRVMYTWDLTSSSYGLGCTVNNSNTITFTGYGQSGGLWNLTTTATVTTGQWYKMHVYYDKAAGFAYMYLDDILVASVACSDGVRHREDKWITIGRIINQNSYSFKGYFDDVVIGKNAME